MEAPPIFTLDSINLSSIDCYQHPKNKIVGICVDKNCKAQNKCMCLDCMFENHSCHAGIKINKIENKYKEKYDAYLLENRTIEKEYNNCKNNLKNVINKLKNDINKDLDLLYENAVEELKKKTKLGNYEEISNIQKNFPPNNKEQLNILIEKLLILYNKDNETNKKELIENYLKNYDRKLNEKVESLKQLINNYIKNFNECNFRWSTKTYSSYGFYYKLEEDNTKATKISDGGTITVCRTSESLELGNKYKLDYFINYKNGDFDVGFGDERIGTSCWLRNSYGYSITSYGLNLDNNNNTSYNIRNCKKVTFIVDLRNYISELFLDDNKVSSFKIKSDYVYYPMIAIRELDNSVKLKVSLLND